MGNTINDALKNLFLELGGDPAKLVDNHNVTDYINDLASALSGGGGSENNMFIVTFTIDWTEGSPTATTDKTFSEVKGAYKTGKTIFAKIQPSEFEQGVFSPVDLVPAQLAFSLVENEPVLNNINAYVNTISPDGNYLFINTLSCTMDANGCSCNEGSFEYPTA